MSKYQPGTFWEYTLGGHRHLFFVDGALRAVSLSNFHPLTIAPWNLDHVKDSIRQLKLVPMEAQ